MAVRRSPRGKWMVDINYHHPDGRTQRVRVVSPIQNKRGAIAHERELLHALRAGTYGKEASKPKTAQTRTHRQIRGTARARAGADGGRASPAPTVGAFVEEFITGHSRVEQLRESTIDSQRGLLANHIVPAVGSVPIDAIRSKHFGELKRAMSAKALSGKTINNALAVLSRMTRFWYEREGLTAPRFKAGLIKVDEKEAEFYEPAEYEALVAAAAEVGTDVHALVLLMGDAGLRQGEVCALQWGDVRWSPEPILRVKRSRYKKKDQPGTKGRKVRTVPMTPRLADALRALPRSRRQAYVLVRRGGEAMTSKAVQRRLEKAEAGAGIVGTGQSHKLRHTFATRLVANRVPLWVIKELLGHKDLRTTQRYLHMLTGAATEAISRLMPGGSSQATSHGTGHGTHVAPPESTI